MLVAANRSRDQAAVIGYGRARFAMSYSRCAAGPRVDARPDLGGLRDPSGARGDVAAAAQPLEARFLAAEVLFARDLTFVSRVSAATVADIYARALEQNLTGMANSWGLLYEHDDAGPVGIRFVMLGEAAVPALMRLLDNATASLIYNGSKEATVGNAYHYRIKDFAAYYLGNIRRIPVAFHREFAERDQEIARLKQQLAAASKSP